MTVPSFGPTEVPNYNRLPLNFSYIRHEKVETQRFNLLDKSIDIGAINRLSASMAAEQDADSYRAIVAMVAKYMDDKDGTGHTWEPVALAPKKGEDPPARRFRGPDGKIHPWDDAHQFLTPEKGSSRRRWLRLMDEDQEAEVDQETLVKLLEYLMEIAGKDRTRA